MTLPTYKQVCDAMERFVLDKSKPQEFRGRVFGWMSEYSERNHARMFEVVTKLKQIELEFHHPDFDVPASIKEIIFNIGCDIDKEEGGFTAQQACFYTALTLALNFIDSNDKGLKAIEYCWLLLEHGG